MKYTNECSLENFEAWSGGKDTLDVLIEKGDCDEVEVFIEMNWPDELPSETDINDLLWFGRDEIAQHLGYADWEEYEYGKSEDDDEDEDEEEESDDDQSESEDEGPVDYDKLADDWAAKVGAKLTILGKEFRKYFESDLQARYVFKCRLERNGKRYTFTFGQSLAEGSKEPTMYDVLAAMTKSEVGTFQDFCAEFCYCEDSRRAEKMYKACCREWDAMQRLFGDVMEGLQDIN